MNREEKLVAGAESVRPRLATDRLGFDSIPYRLGGNFVVDAASRAVLMLLKGRARHAVPHDKRRLVFFIFGFLEAGHFECDAKIAGAGLDQDCAARFDG